MSAFFTCSSMKMGRSLVASISLRPLGWDRAVVGFRVAQRVAGRGVTTSALHELCWIAGEEYGLLTLRAAASNENFASQRVLTKVGFVATGPAEVGGRPGSWYELVLAHL